MVSSITPFSDNNVKSWSLFNFITALGWHMRKEVFSLFLFNVTYVVLSSWMNNFLAAFGSIQWCFPYCSMVVNETYFHLTLLKNLYFIEIIDPLLNGLFVDSPWSGQPQPALDPLTPHEVTTQTVATPATAYQKSVKQPPYYCRYCFLIVDFRLRKSPLLIASSIAKGN